MDLPRCLSVRRLDPQIQTQLYVAPFFYRSTNRAQQLRLEDVLPLLVELRLLIGLVVFPAHGLLALTTGDVSDDVPTRCHVAFRGLATVDVDDAVEEEGFAVLTAEVL